MEPAALRLLEVVKIGWQTLCSESPGIEFVGGVCVVSGVCEEEVVEEEFVRFNIEKSQVSGPCAKLKSRRIVPQPLAIVEF